MIIDQIFNDVWLENPKEEPIGVLTFNFTTEDTFTTHVPIHVKVSMLITKGREKEILPIRIMFPDAFAYPRKIESPTGTPNAGALDISSNPPYEGESDIEFTQPGSFGYIIFAKGKPRFYAANQPAITIVPRVGKTQVTLPVTEKSREESGNGSHGYAYDAFICHASEDKDAIARPLAQALSRDQRVWYDEFTLTLGDSLRRKIDEGLRSSRYGIVILSPSFFVKNWPQKELDGLTARERDGVKVILPVWHNVDSGFVLKYSPMLADKVAVSTKNGLGPVVSAILEVLKQKANASSSTQDNDLSAIKSNVNPTIVEQAKSPVTIHVELPTARWGEKSPVRIDFPADKTVHDLILRIVRDYALPSDTSWYLNSGARILGPENYNQTIHASDIQNDQIVVLTDKPFSSSEPPRIESTKSRPAPPLVYRVTQMQSNGVRRNLPSVGFYIQNHADYAVRIRVLAEVFLDGKSLGYPSPWSGHYDGRRIWNFNPNGRTGSGLKDGNFTIPLASVERNQALMIKVTIKVVDDGFDSPLPVGWVYDPLRNDWYYEPAV